MTRRDYIILASAIKAAYSMFSKPSNHANGVRTAMHQLSRALQHDNPTFDPQRFAAACGMEADYDA